MSDEVEEAREFLRAEVKRSSVRAVAKRAGVPHSALHDFTRAGATGRPIGRNLEPMLAYVRSRPALQGAADDEEPPPNSRKQLEAVEVYLTSALRAVRLMLAAQPLTPPAPVTVQAGAGAEQVVIDRALARLRDDEDLTESQVLALVDEVRTALRGESSPPLRQTG